METLKIEIPKGHEVESFDKSNGVIKFRPKPKPVTERIKTLDDVLKDHGMSEDQWEDICDELEPDEIAYKLIKMIAISLNDGWEPDWSNRNEFKYYPWFEMAGSSGFRYDDYAYWNAYSAVGSRLCFKTRELAEHAGRQFTEVYKQFMVINK